MGKPTEKQIATLKKFKVTEIPSTFEEASALIGAKIKEAYGDESKPKTKTSYSKPQQQNIKVVKSTKTPDPRVQESLQAAAGEADAFLAARWPELVPGEYQYEIKFGMIMNQVVSKYL